MSAAWAQVPLGEVLRRSERLIPLDPEATYKEVKVRINGKGVVERRLVQGVEIASDRRYEAREGQFIISRIDARHGASGLVPLDLDGAVVTNDFPLFDVAKDRLDPAFLNWMSKTASFVELCKRASEGTTNRVRLSEERFKALEIPLPPIDEQRRIVARIEELAAKVEEARGLREQSLEELDAITAAQTTKVFDTLSGHPHKELSVLGVDGENPIQIGPFGAQLHASEFVSEGVPVLNVGNVWPTGLRLHSLDYVTTSKAAQLSRYEIKVGDLLFARSGATLGKVCLVPPECDGWLMTGHLFRVRFDPRMIFNRYAFAALRGAKQIHDQVFGQVRGATRPGYNTTLLGSVQLPVPPLDEQRHIVAELDALQAKIDSMKALQTETAAELDAMLPAILDKAFKGEL